MLPQLKLSTMAVKCDPLEHMVTSRLRPSPDIAEHTRSKPTRFLDHLILDNLTNNGVNVGPMDSEWLRIMGEKGTFKFEVIVSAEDIQDEE